MPRYKIATRCLGGAWGESDFDTPIVGKYRAIAKAIEENKTTGEPKRVHQIGDDKILFEVGSNDTKWLMEHEKFLKGLKKDPNFNFCA